MGKTVESVLPDGSIKKHPHVRGEDDAESYLFLIGMETPPRAWGRHMKNAVQEPEKRNTPTCVGKTIVNACERMDGKKHPHVRGEDELSP